MPIEWDTVPPPAEKCSALNCHEDRVSGSEYCDDHTIQQQLNQRRAAAQPVTTLAQLIKSAKDKGLIAPVQSGYVSQPA